MFKQAVRLVGSVGYHFWMPDMRPLRRRSGNKHLHRASGEYCAAVGRKLHVYLVFIQAALVCQGLLQYLAVAFPQRVWASFGSWPRTIGPASRPRTSCGQCAASRPAGISPGVRLRQQLCEIRHRTAGHLLNGCIPPRLLSQDWGRNLDSRAVILWQVFGLHLA